MPVLLIERLLKVATPSTALTVVVPLNVPPPGFVPMAIVIDAVLPFTGNHVAAGVFDLYRHRRRD